MTAANAPTDVPDTRWLARPLVRLDSVDSTNREAWRRAEAGAGHGLVIVAATQTAGRGRLDRTWLSPAGEGVYVSALLRPGTLRAGAGLVGIAAGLAVAEALADAGVAGARLKWPNDVWIEGRKVAGILTEARDAPGPDGQYVVGVGINVGQTSFPEGLRAPATSVRMVTGRTPDRDEILRRWLVRFEAWADALVANRLDDLESAFSARDMLVGRRISFRLSGSEVVGEVLRISPLAGLVLRGTDGVERPYPPDHVNEVRLVDAEGTA